MISNGNKLKAELIHSLILIKIEIERDTYFGLGVTWLQSFQNWTIFSHVWFIILVLKD